MRIAPQRSHVSRCPPRMAVRQAAIARSARCWTVARAVGASIRIAVRPHNVRQF